MSAQPSPVPGQPIRQQLDELDALLQRMLALPLSQLEETSSAAPPPPPRLALFDPARPLASAPAPSPVVPAMPPMRTAADWAAEMAPPSQSVFHHSGVGSLGHDPLALRHLTEPEAPPAPMVFESGRAIDDIPIDPPAVVAPNLPPPATPMRFDTLPSAPAPTIAPASTTSPAAATPTAPVRPKVVRRKVSWPLWPLSAFNAVCFGILGLFGPPGKWLGSETGRNLLGGTGLVCLAVAVAWGVADAFGLLEGLPLP